MRFKALFFCAALLPSIFTLSACGRSRDASIIVAGSTSVQPYVEILVEDYESANHDSRLDVQGGGSSAGITAVESETADIGMSSRALKDSENHLWSVEIARDGLAVIVNPDNPVSDVSIGQIRGAYAADVINWKELGGPDAKIHVITREEGSGTRSAFEELVMEGRRITPKAIVQDSNGAVRQLVADDPNSIGFISLGLVEIGDKPVKSLKFDGVEAKRDNVINGSYNLFRPFLFITKEQPAGHVMDFIEYVLSPDGKRLLAYEGLIP